MLVPGFGRPVVLCRGRMPRARGMAAYVRDGFGAFRQPKFECGCCEMLVLGSVVCDKTFMCLDNWIFDCSRSLAARTIKT